MPSDDRDPGEDKPQDHPPAPASNAETRPIGVVGIGASAGGLEALSLVLKNVKMDHTAFVVIQHLAPNHESMLTELLARVTPMKVVTIADGMQLEANHVYVIPPNADVAVLHDALHLLPPPAGRGPRLAIDYFFRSLAADRGESAIGVILSGAGTDGTFGLKAIKAEGGITFVQEPATARSDGMPRSALESGYADFCLPPDELGHELSRVSQHPYVARQAAAESSHLHEHLSRIFILIRKEFGNDLTYYKHSTIERRIERRMALHKIEKLPDYVRYLQSNNREVGILYQDILIGVTSFFRDRAPFDLLKETIFPRILEHKKAGDSIRIWSAGCSTGEEAYSIAICLLEFLGDRAAEYKMQFFGTDVHPRSIQYARRGSYPQNIALDVSPERLHRFFRKHENEYQVSRAVRDMVVFATQNLAKDAPFSHVDLISCRNLLIYLQPVLQKRVLRILHYALNPSGFLMLGTSETVGDSPDLFMLTDRKNKIYVKKSITSATGVEFSLEGAAKDPVEPQRRPPRENRSGVTVHQLADRKLLDRYAPPGVLVNENLEILQFRGRSSPFLEPAPGAASLHILKQVRPELQAELRTALNRARTENGPITCEAVPLRDKDSNVLRSIAIDVIPVLDPGASSGCMLVVFRELNMAKRPEGVEDAPAPVEPHPQVRDIERELEATKDYLQRTIEELETSNEELKSSNEELQSSNEELQSTNEELETSKEELQSSNEELTTVNDELQNRMSELSISNDDLANLMSGMTTAVLMVGLDLRIRRVSKTAEALFNLVDTDLGRSVSHLSAQLKNVDVERVVENVIARATASEHEVVIGHGWHMMRAVPYMTTERSIRGAVLLFDKVDEKRQGLDRSLEAAKHASALLVNITHPLLMLDDRLRVIWANSWFYETFRATPDSTLGVQLHTGASTLWANPQLIALVDRTLASGVGFNDLTMTCDFPGIGKRTLKVGGSIMPGPPGRAEQRLVLIVIEEATKDG